LAQAISSVLNQTYSHFELIIVDDGSTDNTFDVVKTFKNNKLKYVWQENKGVAAARNLGIALSKGELIAFLDSDDYWLPQKLELQVRFIDQTHFQVVQCFERWIRREKLVNKKLKHRMPAGWFWEKALEMCLIGPSCVLMHKTVLNQIGLFDPNYLACEDYELWLRLLLHYPVGLIPQELVVKRGGHPDQLSRSILGLDLYRIYALVKTLHTQKLSYSQKQTLLKILNQKIKLYVQGALKRGKNEEAQRILELKRSIRP